MGNDEGRVDLAFLDPVQQVLDVAVHVRLAATDRQPLVHDRPERQVIEIAAVDSRPRYNAAGSARGNGLAQRLGPVRLEHDSRLDLVDGVFDLPKLASAVIAAGAKVSWDDTAKQVNVPGTGRYPIGTAIEAAGNGVTTARVRLDGIATAAA
jgi:hypothetical protein